MSQFFIGLDLGQAQDLTAIAVVELYRPPSLSWDPPTRWAGPRPKPPPNPPWVYHLRHLQRFKRGTPYPEIVAKVADLMATPELRGKCHLIVDATGVGQPVVDLLRRVNIYPKAVIITAGDSQSNEGLNYRVPKRDLVIGLQILFQAGRLKVAEGLPDWPTCLRELMNFKVKIDPLTMHDSYGYAREGIHDDLVIASALACWGAKAYDHAPSYPRLFPRDPRGRDVIISRSNTSRSLGAYDSFFSMPGRKH